MARLGPGWLPGDEKLGIPDDWSLTEHRMAVPDALAACPYCHSEEVESEGHATTLVGYTGGPMEDGNHVTEQRHCTSCDRKWYREWVASSRTVWLASLKYEVLAGTPGCCQTRYGTPAVRVLDPDILAGDYPVRTEIVVLGPDPEGQPRLGLPIFTVDERIGMAVANTKGITKLVIE
jgi:hypothetical protein